MEQSEIFDTVYDETKKEFPKFIIRYKSNFWWHKAIDILLKIITFGRQKYYMTKYITTFGYKIYVPDDWIKKDPRWKAVDVCHERIHMRQLNTYGWFMYAYLYLLFPLPFIFAYGRMKMEKDAYEETLYSVYRYLGTDNLCSDDLRESIVRQFTGANYFWMWPFRNSITKWYNQTVEKILS